MYTCTHIFLSLVFEKHDVTSVLCVATMAWAADSFVENLKHVRLYKTHKKRT